MRDKLESMKTEALLDITAAANLDQVNDIRVKYLGKKGELTTLISAMEIA